MINGVVERSSLEDLPGIDIINYAKYNPYFVFIIYRGFKSKPLPDPDPCHRNVLKMGVNTAGG